MHITMFHLVRECCIVQKSHELLCTRWLSAGNLKRLVTGLFLSNESTIGRAIDLLALVLREASRDRSR